MSDRKEEERRLAALIGGGDASAFRVLFDRYRSGIYRFAYVMLQDRVLAEDIYQEVFMSFLRACRAGTAIDDVHWYLMTACRNRCLNRLTRDRRLESIDDAAVASQLTHEIDVSRADIAEHVTRALAAIAPQYREALLLFEYEGFSYEEIGARLDISHNVVRNRVYRARLALERILAPLFGNE